MSKKVVRSRESYIKNWTAAITGSFVLVSAQAAAAHERGAFREFRANNPGLEKREMRQAFREQVGPRALNITPVPNSSGAGNLAAPAINRHQARIEARMLRNDGVLKQSFQADQTGQLNNIQRGVDLDLTSQVANITLGAKLFGNTSSIEIQVGGEAKTLSAGSQVTAAEYVAAKQVLAGVGQRVTIGNGGGATGGDVDLSAITGNGDVLRASNLTVPVNVTTTGDFSRGSEFRLLGDLSNSGTVHATDSSGNGRGGTLRADDILNNAGASITSDVDLNLHADGALVNHGSISSQGNLTITSSDVTNRGSISSAKDVNLNASPDAGLNVDNTGGTISAANNINVNAGDLDANLSGGNYLSQNLNLNAGAGTVTANVDDVTGSVNSTGYAVHFNSATETLNIGETNLIDPTFYNLGDINFTASVSVAADLTVIATGNITESTGNFTINTNNGGAAVNGGKLTLIAGANITSAPGLADPTLPTANPGSLVTFNQGSIGGGSINLGNVALNTSGSAGGSGGNVLIAAFEGLNAGSGTITLTGGGTGNSIITGGNGAGVNGNVVIIAPNGIDVNNAGVGSINTTGGTGGLGSVRITTAQPTSTGPVTYAADGSLQSGQLVAGSVIEVATVDVNNITANGNLVITSGSTVTVANLSTAAAGAAINIFAGVDPLNNIIDPAATLTLNGDVTSAGSVLFETADNLQQNSNNDVNAVGNIVIDVGIANGAAPGGADYTQNGLLSSSAGQIFVTVGDTYTQGNSAGDVVSGAAGVSIAAGVVNAAGDYTSNAAVTAGNLGGNVGIFVGDDFTANAAISAGGTAGFDGNVNIFVLGDFSANAGAADITAGQGAGNSGGVSIFANNLETVAGANILARNVSLTANSNDIGNLNDLDLDGNVTANAVGGGFINLNLQGSVFNDISDNDLGGGVVAQTINISNATPLGLIQILNNGTTPINFIDVSANANGDITLVEQNGGGLRDGNINFVGSSTSGGTFNVLADRDISRSAGATLAGVTGIFQSNGALGVGNIGTALSPLNVNFTDIRVTALGGPSATAGNVFLISSGSLNFTGANSVVTGTLSVEVDGDLTTSSGTTVQAGTALLGADGNLGTDVLNPFNLDAGIGGADLRGQLGAFVFDPNDLTIGTGVATPSGSNGIFSVVVGGNLFLTETIVAGDAILSADGNIDIAAGASVDSTVFGLGDTSLSADNITASPTSLITADNLNVFLNGGVGTVYSQANGLDSTGSTGSLTINENDGLNLFDQGALTALTVNAGLVASGDVFVYNTFGVDDLDISNDDGNIFINAMVSGVNSVTIDTSLGGGGISGVGSVASPVINLFSDTGSIDTVINDLGAGTSVTAEAGGGGDVKVQYIGSNTATFGASSGNNNYTIDASFGPGVVAIGGNIDGTGVLDITTNTLTFTGANSLTFDSATVQSAAGSGLTLNGANGSFNTLAVGPGVTLTATDGNFVGNGNTNFIGGDLLVTLGNNNGINNFDLVSGPGTLTGNFTNDVTIQAANVVGTSLSNLLQWNTINLLGNTIHNSNGDILLPANLIFTGQNLAIIASGNVTASAGTIINLSSTAADGGSLTILAGFANTPTTVGAETTAGPVTITGFSATGGNISIAGATINTSSTAAGGDAGDVLLYAAGINASTGNTTVGNITATSTNGFGGLVAVGGSSGVTVADITTTGLAGGGDVALGVGTVTLSGPPVFSNGALTSGSIVPNLPAAGNIAYGIINAGTGDVALAGALAVGNTIGGTSIQADNLEVIMGAGSANINSNVNEFQADASLAANGSLILNEGGSVNIDGITGTNLTLQINTVGGDINFIGDVNVGAGDVGLQANNITTATTEKITADALTVDVDGTGTLNTNVNSLSTVLGTGALTVNEDNGIALGAQTADIDVTAGLVAAGDITTTATFSVGNLALANDNGNIIISNDVTGTTSVVLDTAGGAGGISGAGTVIGPSIDLFSDTGNITSIVNGVGGASTSVYAEASVGGDVSLTYLGTGTITLEASSGNGNFTVAGSALNDGDVAINGNIDGTGSLNITTDTLTFNGAFTAQFADVSVQSFLGTGLTLNGAGGSFDTTDNGAGVSFTATDGSLTTNGLTNFNGGDVFMTLAVNNGTNTFTNNGTLNGDGIPPGPDPLANELTITAAVANLGTITNFSAVNLLQGNTIVNNSGNVTLPANLIFNGASLAIIASGNVTATGAVLIDLSSATGDGGTLTILAGYNSTGTVVADVITQTQDPVTVTTPSATGGNINLTGVNIITSSSLPAGDAGDVLLLARGGVGGSFLSAGTVTVGNITANGGTEGGVVAVGGSSNVTVGNISTVGVLGDDGAVLLAVGTANITGGSPIFTDGIQSGGVFVPGALTAGNLVYGTVNAGTGDVNLGGAFASGNSIVGGVITADTLSYTIGAGTAVSTVGSNSSRLNVTATVAGGSVTVNDADNLIIDDVAGTDLDLTVNAPGDIAINGDIAVGAGTVTFNSDDVLITLGSLTANSLALNLTGNAALVTSVANLLDSSGATISITNTGNLIVNNVTATGALSIINDGTLNIAAGADLLSNQSIFLQTSDASAITINTGASIITDVAVKNAAGDGDVSILQGIAPTRTRNLRGRNLVIDDTQDGFVLSGRGRSSDGTRNYRPTGLTPNNNLTAINATLLIKGQTRNGVTIGGGVTITADPPVTAMATSASIAPVRNDAPAQSGGMTEALLNAPSILAPINTIPTMTSAPSINLSNIGNTLSNLATANTNLGALSQMEDDSYMVTYAPMGQIVDGNVCSDMDFGFTSGSNAGSGHAVSTMKHSDCVTLDNGSALFVPSKDMTVVTPKGSVKLAANSVAFVSVNSNQLSVYDINDSHKSSVVVSTGGRDLSLSPGRHLVVTHDQAKTFAEVNPIESIMHRSVNRHELGAGKRAFISEFSIPSAVNVVKPLKALLNSGDAEAKKVAARILKTSAVVLMVGGQAPFDFHAKPRTVALNWK